jgi:hypothetical protein
MKRDWIPAALIAGAIGLATVVLGYLLYSAISKRERISVTGLAQVDFSSDLIVWQGRFDRKAAQLDQAYAMIKKDADMIRQYLVQKGVDSREIIFGSVEIQKSYSEVPVGGNLIRQFDGYALSQSVKIESKNVDHIEAVSRQISELLNMGVELQSELPKYYYSKLNALKIDLLARASADGMLRAKTIAENSGNTLGQLFTADMGTFQITAPNSDEEYTWGGAFNTTSRRKTASITVSMVFLAR